MSKFWKKPCLTGLALLWAIFAVCSVGYAETDVTSKVQLVQSRLMFDLATNTSYLDVSVKNISQDVLITPIKVVISTISPASVTVANPDGATSNGILYFEYNLSGGQLLPGQSSVTKRWSFNNRARARFSYTNLVMSGPSDERINGIIVPPAPDPTVNNSTIAGVDINGNGIRDDVERMIAQEFGTNPGLYEKAIKHATTLQNAITNPTPQTISSHIDPIRCTGDNQLLTDLRAVTIKTLDIPMRRGAYGKAFADIVITKEGCQ